MPEVYVSTDSEDDGPIPGPLPMPILASTTRRESPRPSSRRGALLLACLAASCTASGGERDAGPGADAAEGGPDGAADGGPDADGGPNADGGPDADRPCVATALLGPDPGATFDEWAAAIASVQLVSEDGLRRLGTTWEAELGRARARFVAACTAEEVHWALTSLANSFHDGHSWIEADGPSLVAGLPPVAVGLEVRPELDGEAWRYLVVASREPEVAVGREVTSVDGLEVAALEEAHVEWLAWGSSPDGAREDLARWMALRFPFLEPTPEVGAPLRLGLRDPASGEEVVVTLRWEAAAAGGSGCPPFASPCEDDHPDYREGAPSFVGLGYCVYDTAEADLAIVRYRTFYYPWVGDPFEADCLEGRLDELGYELTMAEARRLGSPEALMARDRDELLDELRGTGRRRVLLDVRENGGGSFDPGLVAAFAREPFGLPVKSVFFAPAFRDDPSLLGDADIWLTMADGTPVSDPAGRIIDELLASPDALFSRGYPFYCTTDACLAEEGVLEPAGPEPLAAVVLTGPACLSSCDDLVSVMSANGIARLAGLPTGAADSPFRYTLRRTLADGTPVRQPLTIGRSLHPGTETPLEAHPREVDFPVPPTAANRGRYLEAVLEAIGWD